jgi:hypothetical protein
MSKDIKERVNGKAFITALDKCQTTKEVIDLLSNSMDRETLKDRISHVSNLFVVNKLKDKQARFNIATNPSCKVSREDIAIMAAFKYCELTEGSDDMIKDFKEKVQIKIRKDVLSANRDRFRASQTVRTVDNSLQM